PLNGCAFHTDAQPLPVPKSAICPTGLSIHVFSITCRDALVYATPREPRPVVQGKTQNDRRRALTRRGESAQHVAEASGRRSLLMPHVALAPFTGFRVREEEMRARHEPPRLATPCGRAGSAARSGHADARGADPGALDL